MNSFHSVGAVPVVESERLTLRGHRLEDFSECAAMWADSLVTRHISRKPFSEEETWTRFLRYFGHWALMGFGYWVVEEKATGHFIGELGFADYKRNMEPSIKGLPELGWVLTSQAHGKGFATEAARAALVWVEAHFGSARTVCIIDPENLASIRVAEKCGYKLRQRAAYKGDEILLFDRP